MVVRLLASCAGRPLPPGKFLALISLKTLSRPQGHSAAGRIRSIEKSNYLIGNRTRDLPAYSIVPQPTTLPLAPSCLAAGQYVTIYYFVLSIIVDTANSFEKSPI
jgi:hypothetical protein